MSIIPKALFTPEEYLLMERNAQAKSELHGGEIFAMTGASRSHNLIALNIAAAFHEALRDEPCEVYMGDMRVKVTPSDYVYPDVAVSCGEPLFEDTWLDTLLNPLVVVEVLSPSSQCYDRGDKFLLYRALPSMQCYVLASQTRMHVEVFERREGHWLYTEQINPNGEVYIRAIRRSFCLDTFYRKVPLRGFHNV